MGLMTQEELAKTSVKKKPNCRACKLEKKCNTPKMGVYGKGDRKILVVLNSISSVMDNRKTMFTGSVYNKLNKLLAGMKINLQRDCWVVSALDCYTKIKTVEDKVMHCQPHVLNVIKEYKPKLILLLGDNAVKSVIGNHVKEDIGSVVKWRGFAIPDQIYGCWLFSTYSMEVMLGERANPAYERVVKNDIEIMSQYIDKEFPIFTYNDKVKILTKKPEIEKLLRYIKKTKPKYLSWDIESEGLKPHSKQLEVYTVSFCYSEKQAYSFPWYSEISSDILSILIDPEIGKIGHNIKFEHLWMKVMYLIDVYPWKLDTILTSHMIDNRKGVTGLKFQAYINFGIADYNSHIEPFLKSDNSYTKNKIKHLNIMDVLLYNGVDALIGYKLAMKHIDLLNLEV